MEKMNLDGYKKMQLKKLTKQESGFTTLEIMLVVSLIAIVAAATIGIYFTAKRRSDLDTSINVTTQYIRRAQVFSQSGKKDSEWSVRITDSKVLLHKGPDFDSRDQDFDEEYLFPSSLTHSGLSDISFSKLEGIPSVTGTIQLQDITHNSATISINSKGLVDY
ncbi:MAG: type II secretion system protein [bacterium]